MQIREGTVINKDISGGCNIDTACMEAGYADGYVMAGMALSGIEQKMQTLVKPELSLCLHLVFTFISMIAD